MNLELRSDRALAERFRSFARVECGDTMSGQSVDSPIYAVLSQHIADSSALLILARECLVTQPIPNLFLAAVKFLALNQPANQLGDAYRDIEAGLDAPMDFVDRFDLFCGENTEAIVRVVKTKRVQSNEIGRCSALMPILGSIAKASEQDLAIIDVGAGAGLNLLWDHYDYEYSDGAIFGSGKSGVKVSCTVHAPLPPINAHFPDVVYRVGVDLNPIVLSNEEDYKWMLALIWLDHPKRKKLLAAARETWLRFPPNVVKGDAVWALPKLAAAAPEDAALCVYHCHALNQFPRQSKIGFLDCIEYISKNRTVYHVSLEEGSFFVDRFEKEKSLRLFHGTRSAHGHWLRWGAV